MKVEEEGTENECLLCYERPHEIAELGKKVKAGIYVLEKNIVVEGIAKVTDK